MKIVNRFISLLLIPGLIGIPKNLLAVGVAERRPCALLLCSLASQAFSANGLLPYANSPERELRTELIRDVQLKIATSSMDSPEIHAAMERVVPPRHAVFSNAIMQDLGEAVLRMPIIVRSILATWPGIVTLEVVTDFPKILKGLDPRVTALKNENDLASRMADLWINWEDIPSVRGRRSWQLMSGLKVWLRHANSSDLHIEKTRDTLREMGFRASDETIGLLPRDLRYPNTILLNPQGVTNQKFFDVLRSSWIETIVDLLDQGYEVALNEGRASDVVEQERTQHILEELKKKGYRNHPRFSVFSGDVDNLRTFVGQVAGVITIDTGVFHLARLYAVPVVVFVTPMSKGYVPEGDTEILRRMTTDEFRDDAALVRQKIMEMVPRRTPIPLPRELANLLEMWIKVQDSLLSNSETIDAYVQRVTRNWTVDYLLLLRHRAAQVLEDLNEKSKTAGEMRNLRDAFDRQIQRLSRVVSDFDQRRLILEGVHAALQNWLPSESFLSISSRSVRYLIKASGAHEFTIRLEGYVPDINMDHENTMYLDGSIWELRSFDHHKNAAEATYQRRLPIAA